MAEETAVGAGFRVIIGDRYDTQTAEEKYTVAYRAHPEYKAQQRPWADVQIGGWGAVVHAWYAANGIDDTKVGPNAVFRLGNTDDGGQVFQVPESEHWDIGRAKHQPLYRTVKVYIDQESLARREQAKLDEAAAAAMVAKESELARLRAAAAQANREKELAEARIKAGLGVQAKELTIYNGGRSVDTASAPAESMNAVSHRGKSIIDKGMWESITGGADPSSLGLPFAILAYQPDGSVRPAKEEYDSLLMAARSTPLGPFQFGPGYSAAQISLAQRALQSIGITG